MGAHVIFRPWDGRTESCVPSPLFFFRFEKWVDDNATCLWVILFLRVFGSLLPTVSNGGDVFQRY
jgi:hypothetical protein